MLYKRSITKSTSQEKHIISTSKSFSFAEEIGNQFNSTLSLFGILLLCRDDIAYLSEDQLYLDKVFLLSRPRLTTVRSGSTVTRTSCAVKENWRDWGYHRANWDRCPIKTNSTRNLSEDPSCGLRHYLNYSLTKRQEFKLGTLPPYLKITKKVITYFIIPQLIAMELILYSLSVAMARS